MLRRLRNRLVLLIPVFGVHILGVAADHGPAGGLPIQTKQAPGRYEGDDSTFIHFTPAMDETLKRWYPGDNLKKALQSLRHLGDAFCQGGTEKKIEEFFTHSDEMKIDRAKVLRFLGSPELGLSKERIKTITTVAGRRQKPPPTLVISKDDRVKADEALAASLAEEWKTEFPSFAELMGKEGKSFVALVRKFQAAQGSETDTLKKIGNEIRAWGEKRDVMPGLQEVLLKSSQLNLAHDCKARLSVVRDWSGKPPAEIAGSGVDLTPIKEKPELLKEYDRLIYPFASGKKLSDSTDAVRSALSFARQHGLDEEKVLNRIAGLSGGSKAKVEKIGREAIALAPLNRSERLTLAGHQTEINQLQGDRGAFKSEKEREAFLEGASKLWAEAGKNPELARALSTIAQRGYFGDEREAAMAPLTASLPLKAAGVKDLDKFFTAAQEVIRNERAKKRDPARIAKEGKLSDEESKAFEAFRKVEEDFAKPAQLFAARTGDLETKAQEKVVRDFLSAHKASALAANADELKAVIKDLHGMASQKDVSDDFKKAAQSFVDRYFQKNKDKAGSISIEDMKKLLTEEKASEGSFALGLNKHQQEHLLSLLNPKPVEPPKPPVVAPAPVTDGKTLYAALSKNPEWKPLLDRIPEAAFEKWFAGLSNPGNSEEFLTAADALLRKLTPTTPDQAGRFLITPADRDLFIKMAQGPAMLKAFGATDANDDRVKTAIGLAKAHSWSNDRVIEELRKPQEKPDLWALQQRIKPELEQKRVQQFSKWFGTSPTESLSLFEAVPETRDGQQVFVRRITWEKLGRLVSGMPDNERIALLGRLKGIEAGQRSEEESWTITALEGVLKQRILNDRASLARGLPSNEFQAVRQNVAAMEQALGIQSGSRISFGSEQDKARNGFNTSISDAWGGNGFFAQLKAAAPTATRGTDRGVGISLSGVQKFFEANPDTRVLTDRMQRYFEKRSGSTLFEDSAAQMAAAFTQNGDTNATRILAWKPDPMFSRFEAKEFRQGIKIVVDAPNTLSFRKNLLTALEALNAQGSSGLGANVSALRRGTLQRQPLAAEAPTYKLEGNRLVPVGTVPSSPPGTILSRNQ